MMRRLCETGVGDHPGSGPGVRAASPHVPSPPKRPSERVPKYQPVASVTSSAPANPHSVRRQSLQTLAPSHPILSSPRPVPSPSEPFRGDPTAAPRKDSVTLHCRATTDYCRRRRRRWKAATRTTRTGRSHFRQRVLTLSSLDPRARTPSGRCRPDAAPGARADARAGCWRGLTGRRVKGRCPRGKMKMGRRRDGAWVGTPSREKRN